MKLWRYTSEVHNYTSDIGHGVYSYNTRQCSPQNRSEHDGEENMSYPLPTHNWNRLLAPKIEKKKVKRKQIMHCDTTAMYAYTVAQS